MIFGELYRQGSDWKFRAVGQGFVGGLGPLAKNYGVSV
jgi:tellurium resistance protein TerD